MVGKTTVETLSESAPHSVALGRTAAGKTTWEVKCYGLSPEQAYESAMHLHTKLCNYFDDQKQE